jgi:YHS domain-containing protein
MSVRKGLVAVALAAGMYPWAASAAQFQDDQLAPGQSQASAESLQCAHAQPLITQTIEAAMARLETARQANSPAQMRAAIDDLQGALRDVRAQLTPCAAMQTPTAGHTMPNVRAPSGAPGMPAMSPGRPQPAPGAVAPAATDPHAGHAMTTTPAKEASQAKVMDPVTGRMVDPATAPKTIYQGQTYYFSSEEARREFLQNPVKFVKKPKQ